MTWEPERPEKPEWSLHKHVWIKLPTLRELAMCTNFAASIIEQIKFHGFFSFKTKLTKKSSKYSFYLLKLFLKNGVERFNLPCWAPPALYLFLILAMLTVASSSESKEQQCGVKSLEILIINSLVDI